MPNSLFQRPFHDVVVQRYTWFFEEKCQFLPVVEEVGDGLPKAGVRLHQPFVELGLKPNVQLFHDRFTVLLVECEALLRSHALFPCHGVIAVDLTESFQHQSAGLRKICRYLYEIPPTVRITVGY
jgi:hypothetical protein